jgi:hypothetical protein
MKNRVIRFTVPLVFGVLFFGFISKASNPITTNQEEIQIEKCNTCKYDQCHAVAKSTGLRCKHCVSYSGDIYCYQHK